MKKKFTMQTFLISLVATAVVFGGIGYGIGFGRSSQTQQSDPKRDDLAKVHDLFTSIEENYYQKVDKGTLIEGALKGMTEALGDPYTTYLDEDGAAQLSRQLSDSFEGIGARLQLKDGFPQIAQTPVKDSPAAKAGLKAEDLIIKVDDNETKGQTLDEVVGMIRGEKGTKVKLSIRRGTEDFDIEVTRDTISNETVFYKLDKEHNTIGHVQITQFGEGTAQELKTAIKELRKEGAKSFVLDVRQNPGGLLDQVEIMSSMFLKDGKTIVEFANAKGSLGKTSASETLDHGFKVTEPVVVLVDEGSASAAEIFAGALKDSAKVAVIGTNTFGKGTVQKVSPLDKTSGVKMTVEKWLTPSGEWINEKGLAPTIKVDYPDYAYLTPMSFDQTLKKDMQSDEVKRLNAFLKALGNPTEGNLFTEATKTAVEKIQDKHHLSVNGEADKETVQAIQADVAEMIRTNDPIYDQGIKELLK